MTRVPFLDLGPGHEELREELEAAWRRVLAGDRFVLGEEVARFEDEWADACGCEHAVGVGSGHDALALTMRALGIGPGDEVVVPSHTFVATWLAVSSVGAVPVPAEPDPGTHLVDAASLEAVIGPRTAALLPVHLYGTPVDAGAFEAIASRHGVALLFDAAQAHGARIAGRPVGAHGTASAWSFYPSKNLGALGDGGAVTTNDDELARRLRRLRSYGMEGKGHVVERGANSRLDELQAALLRVKLPHLEAWNRRRREVAARYDRELAGVAVGSPQIPADREPARHLYVVTTHERDALRAALAGRGVETGLHYPVAPHRQPVYADLWLRAGSLPVAEELAASTLSLPLGPYLTVEDQQRVIRALRELRPPP